MSATRKTAIIPPPGTQPDPGIVRCAIYTRKSTEENLDTDFNTLDAQRESAEAYIASQRASGWTAIPDRYDDGGYSGGNIDRPAFKRLMTDIEKGRVDCVLVYKIDRLSRSLVDFAKMMEVFERHGVSLVSVTQQFNTATSMGRLTVNILLSFAQFEREQIAERIRDKMGAARRKGKWVGGLTPLGYDIALVPGQSGAGRLVVNEREAEQVRALFRSYIRTGSQLDTARELNERGWTTKKRPSQGAERGGRPFDKATVSHVLRNRVYRGEVAYRGEIYPGEHDAIIDLALWNAAHERLAANRKAGGGAIRNKSGAILRGLVRCGSCGCGMSHAWSGGSKENKRYRYYVCNRAQKRGRSECPTKCVPAGELEAFVVGQIRAVGHDPELRKHVVAEAHELLQKELRRFADDEAALRRELKHTKADLSRMSEDEAASALVRLEEGRARLAVLVRERDGLRTSTPTAAELIGAVERFDPVWNELTYPEQERILRLLVEAVTVDAVRGTVKVAFRPSGFKVFGMDTGGNA